MRPLVSIIIPCFNHGKYINEVIDSIKMSAKYCSHEIIIINDGSSDEETLLILSELDEHKYLIIHQKNQGLSNARNKGISLSKGKYIITIDADDKITPVYFKKGISILEENPEIGVVYGNSTHFGDESRKYIAGQFSLKKLLVENYISSCILFRKEVWENCNGYDPNLTAYEDWDFNLSAVTAGWKFHYIPEIMFEYRILRNSMLRSHKNLKDCVNYIAKKHGILYRNEFLKNITIKDRIKSISIDLFKKIIGRPNY